MSIFVGKGKDLTSLLTASLTLPIVNFLAIFYITKSISPGEYGEYVYIISFLTLISQLIGFGMYPSVRIVVGEIKFRREYKSIILGLLFFSLLGSIVSCLVSLLIIYNYHKGSDFNLFSILLFSIPFCSLYYITNILDNYFQGNGDIFNLSLLRFFPKFLFLIFLVLNDLSFQAIFSPSSFFYSFMFHSISLIIIFFFAIKIALWHFDFFKRNNINALALTILGVKKLYYKNKSYGFSVYIGGVFLLVGYQIPVLIITHYGGDTEQAGYYSIAMMLTSPIIMLPQVVSTVLFKDFIHLKRLPTKLLKQVLIFSLTVAVIFIFSSKFVINLVYGPEYSEVISPLNLLILFSSLNGINMFVERFFHAKSMGTEIRNSNVFSGILLICLLFIFTPKWQSEGAACALLLSALVNSTYKFIQYRRYCEECKYVN